MTGVPGTAQKRSRRDSLANLCPYARQVKHIGIHAETLHDGSDAGRAHRPGITHNTILRRVRGCTNRGSVN
jgi:hypothetical protein